LIERATTQGGLVFSGDVPAVGFSHDAWHRCADKGLWIAVAPGVWRHAASPLTFEMQVVAGSHWLGDRGALFGGAALHWLGVDVDPPERAAFLVRRGLRSIPNWMEVHTTLSWTARDVVRHRGVRTSSATRAILDLATTGASARRLEMAIDAAIRLRLTAVSRLSGRLAETGGRGRPGTTLLRELMIDSGGESHLERRFLRLVRTAGLPRPDCQVVYRSGGRTVARVIVEVSGRLGHVSDRDRQRDARRRNHLQSLGNVVIEFTTADVIDDPAYVLGMLRHELHV
jgi:Protein of unknown function (DUF559)